MGSKICFRSRLISAITLLSLMHVSISSAEVEVLKVADIEPPVTGYSSDGSGQLLRFYDDNSYLTKSGLYSAGKFKTFKQLDAKLAQLNALDRSESGIILGAIPNLEGSETTTIVTWKKPSRLEKKFTISELTAPDFLVVLGGGIDEQGNIKVLYSREFPYEKKSLTLIVKKSGEEAKSIDLTPGLGLLSCPNEGCLFGIEHLVVGMGNDRRLWVTVDPTIENLASPDAQGLSESKLAGLGDDGSVIAAPSILAVPKNIRVFTSEKNFSSKEFSDKKANLLISKSNSVLNISGGKLKSDTDVARIGDYSLKRGAVGSYTSNFTIPRQFAFILPPKGKSYVELECKLAPSILKDQNLLSAKRINSQGNILARSTRVGFSAKEESVLIKNIGSETRNFCATSKLVVGKECKDLFNVDPSGTVLNNLEPDSSRKCSFSITTKIGGQALTDGHFQIIKNVNGNPKKISCSKGTCKFSISFSSPFDQFQVLGPVNSKRARNKERFLIGRVAF